MEKLQSALSSFEGDGSKNFTVQVRAKRALRRIAILTSSDRENTLEQMLLSRNDPDDSKVLWALRIARRTQHPRLLEILRNRLDAGEVMAASRIEYLQIRGGSDRTFDATMKSSAALKGSSDRYYDDVLVAYAELGGKLTDPEKQRLYTFGYQCDPATRLQELLASEESR